MAWTVPLTAVSGAALTDSQWNASVRDNFLVTLPALVTAAGQLGVATGTNAIAARNCPSNTVATAEAVVATSYGNISGGTVGPTISSLTTGSLAFVVLSCNMFNTTGGAASYMSYQVSGATSDAPDDSRALYYESSNAGDLIAIGNVIPHGLTPGVNTFQAKYRVGAGNGTFGSRRIAVLNFGT
jgi:hypothetical protein